LSKVACCDHGLEVPVLNTICTAGTYSLHYAYSAHAKAAACMLRSSGVVFVADHRFPDVGRYNIDSRLNYSYPAASPPGVNWLATLIGTLCGRMQNISNKSSAVAEMGDHGQIDTGPKEGGAVPLSWSAGNPFNTMWPAPMSTSVPSGVFIHPAVWPQ